MGTVNIDSTDPWKVYEGRGEGKIKIFSKRDGSIILEKKLSSIPIHDGIIAANKKLYISLNNGTVQCWK